MLRLNSWSQDLLANVLLVYHLCTCNSMNKTLAIVSSVCGLFGIPPLSPAPKSSPCYYSCFDVSEKCRTIIHPWKLCLKALTDHLGRGSRVGSFDPY